MPLQSVTVPALVSVASVQSLTRNPPRETSTVNQPLDSHLSVFEHFQLQSDE